MTKQLEIEVADGICRITFQRPEAFNALNEEMARGLVEQLVRAQADDAIRVVVITGSGFAFSAGADLTGDNPVEHFGEQTMDGANLITRSVVGLGKPVVAAVNGIAAGIGASICFAADLAVAKESASFLLAFSRIGLMPDGGPTRSPPRPRPRRGW
jgi:enoyl-CoA hydratase